MQNRTVQQKVADALAAYEHFRAELTPVEMRTLITVMTAQTPGEGDDIHAYTSLVSASMALAREVGKNDRHALLAAVLLTQSGVVRPLVTEGDDV